MGMPQKYPIRKLLLACKQYVMEASMKINKLKKISNALISGVLAYVFHYFLLLPLLMGHFEAHALDVLYSKYWWFSTLGPIIFMPLIMKLYAFSTKNNWKFYILIPVVQLLLLPLLYFFVTVVDGGKTGGLMWIVLGYSVLKVALVETIITVVISLLNSRTVTHHNDQV